MMFHFRRLSLVLASIAVCLALTSPQGALAQGTTGSLHGQVADPTGAVIPQAQITVTSSAGKVTHATADASGSYQAHGLASGMYTVGVAAPGFAPYASAVTIAPGQARLLNIAMQIQMQQQQVTVSSTLAPALSTSAESNASSVVLQGKALEALSNDPDELADELAALAGPSAGPNGGQVFIDGFTGGQLPPKSSIREIRINQDPFSSEYDRLGYGRIEILTKPGTDRLHGRFFVNANDSSFNSPNPFTKTIPPYHTLQFNGSLSGPLNKSASFNVGGQYRDIQNVSIVNAIMLDENFNPITFTAAVPAPQTRANFTPRVDFQIGASNTLTIRYQLWYDSEDNEGVGQFNLASRGYNGVEAESSLQVSDTQIFGPHVVNETRFRYVRDRGKQSPANTETANQVQGSFTNGGSSAGSVRDADDRYEFQNYASISHKNHFIRFGVRLRDERDSNSSNSNFNGTFTFGSRTHNGQTVSALDAYQITAKGLAAGESMADIIAAGGGASQYTVGSGNPATIVNMFDAALYAGDDWKIQPNFTLSYGLRWESQTGIRDHSDWAPRLSFAYGLGNATGRPSTVIRGGFGLFYDRFQTGQILQAKRQNGITQTEYVLPNPDFYSTIPPDISGLPGAQSTIYQISPSLHAPMTRQMAIGVEQQVTRDATVSVTYLNSFGTHQLITRNANAPLPGNGIAPPNPTRPNGKNENIYQYFSGAIFKQNQLIANTSLRPSNNLALSAFYQLGYVNSDSGGPGSNPSDSYNIRADYGRAAFDVRHRLVVVGSYTTPRYGVTFSPFVVAQSGRPFNVTVSQDLNGDSFFNDRPSFASDPSAPTVVHTQYGNFNTAPNSGEKLVPPNFGNGPALYTFNLRLSKTIGFGPKEEGHAPGGGGGFGGGHGHGLGMGGLNGGGGGRQHTNTGVNHRFNLTFNAQALNLFNHVNLAPPVGTVDSQLFGQSNALAGNVFSSRSASRRIYLQAVFQF